MYADLVATIFGIGVMVMVFGSKRIREGMVSESGNYWFNYCSAF